MIRRHLQGLLEDAVAKVVGVEDATPWLKDRDLFPIGLERPPRKELGDFSTNIALGAAKHLSRPAREIAQEVISCLPKDDLLLKATVAGPGFLNLFVSHRWLHQALLDVVDQGARYGGGWDPHLAPEHIQLEFVSANPTGPLTVAAGRHAAFGDALARLFELQGHSVVREYYINDAGKQLELFAHSVEVRYLQALGRHAEFPDDGYHGTYVTELGKRLADERHEELVGRSDDIKEWALRHMLGSIGSTLQQFGVDFDVWFSERSLHAGGSVDKAVDDLRNGGHVYEADAALFFASQALGDEKDRVLVRANGEPTYFAADVAYLKEKLSRGFDSLIYIWGADHHGYIERMRAAAAAFGAADKVEFLIGQMVNLFAGGRAVRMSKRTGELVTLDELIDEVGSDAARYMFLTRSFTSTLDFDLDLAKAQTQDNPVYYVQYAHARICSVLRLAEEQKIKLRPVDMQLAAELVHESELEVLRLVSEMPETVHVAASLRSPSRLTTYAHDLAAAFHAFYRDCKVISDDATLTQARLSLLVAVRQVLANVFHLVGVSAPERM